MTVGLNDEMQDAHRARLVIIIAIKIEKSHNVVLILEIDMLSVTLNV